MNNRRAADVLSECGRIRRPVADECRYYDVHILSRAEQGGAEQTMGLEVMYARCVYGGAAPSYHDLYCQQEVNLHGGNRS